jgi:putative lipoprotein
MSKKSLVTIFLLTLIILLSACGGVKQAAVTGVIDHPHSMTFPAGTVLTVQLLDTTKEGLPGKVIAEYVVRDRQIGIPMPFAVTYEPGKINQNHSYSVRVIIEDSNGNLTYSSQKEVPVITHGNPRVDIDVFVDLVNK